jgi:hypothetical protein
MYEETMEELHQILGIGKYNVLIDDFKKNEGRFPNSLEEVYLTYKYDNPEGIGYIEKEFFIDIFNKKGRWVGYFPIYNSDDSQIISYLLLSAGIDGKLDNVNDPCNKLHLDDWKQKLKLYNPDEFDNDVNIFSDDFDNSMRPCQKIIEKERPYDAREEKSGKKDLLIHAHHIWCAPSYYEGE